MGDFDRNAGRRSSGRGRFDRGRSGGFHRGGRSGGFGRGRDRGDDRGRSGGYGRDRDDRGHSDRFDRRDRRPEMHEATCDKCGDKCEVPFRPTSGKPLYCDDCFKDKSNEAGSRSELGKPKNNDEHNQIIKKLDKILSILESVPVVEEEPKEIKKPKKKEKKLEPSDLEEPKSIEKPKKKKKKS